MLKQCQSDLLQHQGGTADLDEILQNLRLEELSML